MMNQIPDVVILRLPTYTRVLALLEDRGVETINSEELGGYLRGTPAQIRKDLSYFGKFGKQGRGYNVKHLLEQLRRILGLDKEWKMILVGVGHLGHAIAGYEGFSSQGFQVVAAFDTDANIVGSSIGKLVIRDVAEVEQSIEVMNIRIAILAVPADKAQEVADMLVRSGIKAILNYAPTSVRVPQGIWVRNIDPVVALQSTTYYLSALPAGE